MGLKEAFNNYVSILKDLDIENVVVCCTAQKLEEKLKLHFVERTNIHKGKYKRNNSVICNSNITLEEALKLPYFQKSKQHQLIKDVATTLRAIIKNVTRTNLPSSGIAINEITDGEVQILVQLIELLIHRVVGSDHRSDESASKIGRAKSFAADTMFCVTNGRKKLSKHLKLGLAVKSMTGSEKLIGMLNRYGHYVSYTTTEDLEMYPTVTVTSASKFSLSDLVFPNYSLRFGIAYDNFQQFVETLSGKDILHGTEGIV